MNNNYSNNTTSTYDKLVFFHNFARRMNEQGRPQMVNFADKMIKRIAENAFQELMV